MERRKVKWNCSLKFQLKVWGIGWGLGEIFTKAFGLWLSVVKKRAKDGCFQGFGF